MRLDVQAALVRGELVPGDVEVEDGVIVNVGLPGGTRGRIAVPGFVDLQVNGYGGVDFLSASTSDYDIAGNALLEGGVTAYQPTFITAPETATLDALRAMPANGSFPRVVGAHVEGPFLSPERLGTHPREHRRDPDLALLERLLDAGRVTEFTLAPELDGAGALITRLLEREIVVSAGHTNATAAEAHAAFDLGVSTVSPPLQRDAPLPLARPRSRRRRAYAARRLRADDRRRTPPRRGDGSPRVGSRRRPLRTRQRRDRRGRRCHGPYQLGDMAIGHGRGRAQPWGWASWQLHLWPGDLGPGYRPCQIETREQAGWRSAALDSKQDRGESGNR